MIVVEIKEVWSRDFSKEGRSICMLNGRIKQTINVTHELKKKESFQMLKEKIRPRKAINPTRETIS